MRGHTRISTPVGTQPSRPQGSAAAFASTICRHTCASYLAKQGCSLLQIANVLGDKTLAMVKRYAHLMDDDKAKVIDKMIAAKGL